MKYIDKHYTNTLEIKQSKFITHLVPSADYEDILKKLKLFILDYMLFLISFYVILLK